jgi:pimeloyl-ACP methyl ester carboxylesterase
MFVCPSLPTPPITLPVILIASAVALSYLYLGAIGDMLQVEAAPNTLIIAITSWELIRARRGRLSRPIIALTYILHGSWDALHHLGYLGDHIGMTMCTLCIIYDWSLAAYIWGAPLHVLSSLGVQAAARFDAWLWNSSRSLSHSALDAKALGAAAVFYVPTPHGRVRVAVWGQNRPEGIPVLIIPDGPTAIEHIAPTAATLAHTGIRSNEHEPAKNCFVIGLDLPGFGHSSPAAPYTHTIPQAVEVINAVLRCPELAITTPIILNASCVNGFYALGFARAYPYRVRGLVLAQTPDLAGMQNWSGRIIHWLIKIPIVGQVLVYMNKVSIIKAWFKTSLPKLDSYRRPEGILAAWTHLSTLSVKHHGVFCLATLSQGFVAPNQTHQDLAPLIQPIAQAIPVILMWGLADHSHALARTSPSCLSKVVPHAVIQTYENTGHFPNLERPDDFYKAVASIVNQTP